MNKIMVVEAHICMCVFALMSDRLLKCENYQYQIRKA